MTGCVNLSTIQAQFLAMVPVRNLDLDKSEEILQSPESQLEILKMTIHSEICRRYPPSVKYQQAFLKALIQKCEAIGCELADELYETYTALLSKAQSENQEECYRSFLLFCDDSIKVTLKESVNMISKGTTGLNTWPAAGFLAEWAMENNDVLYGRVVLELGSGMGLTGLTVCKVCKPHRYIFSDCHDSVLRNLKENITNNIPGIILEGGTINRRDNAERPDRNPDIAVECIDWEAVEEKDVHRWRAGVILAADVVYDTRIIEPLVHLLHLLLTCQGDGKGRPTAYIASTIRNEETYQAFLQALEKHQVSFNKIQNPANQRLYYERSCSLQILRLWVKTS